MAAHPDGMTSRASFLKVPNLKASSIGCSFPSVAGWMSVSTTTIWAIRRCIKSKLCVSEATRQFPPFAFKSEVFKGRVWLSRSFTDRCLLYPTSPTHPGRTTSSSVPSSILWFRQTLELRTAPSLVETHSFFRQWQISCDVAIVALQEHHGRSVWLLLGP